MHKKTYINCSLCGNKMESDIKTLFIVWYGTQIFVCNDPCSFHDFIKSQ